MARVNNANSSNGTHAAPAASSCLEQIGSTAGQVWHVLNEDNSLSLTQLAKQVDAPRDVIMQAIGWLAREGKVDVAEKGRSRTIELR